MGFGNTVAKASMLKWILGLGLLGFLVLAAVGFAYLNVMDYPIVALRAESVSKEYRAAGFPWTAEDVEAMSGEGTNISPDFKKQLESRLPIWEEFNQQEMNVLLYEKKYADAIAVMNDLKNPTVDEAIALGELDRIWFAKDWDMGAKVLLPELAELRKIGRMGAERAVVRAGLGDLSGALFDLRRSYSLGNKVGKNPTLIAALIGFSIQSTVLRGVADVAEMKIDDPSWLASIRMEIEGWQSETDVLRSLKVDTYLAVSTLRNLELRVESDESFSKLDMRNPKRDGLPKKTFARAYLVRYMEAHLALNKLISEEENLTRAFARFDQEIEDFQSPRASDVANAIFLPVMSQVGTSAENNILSLEFAKAALKAHEFRIKNGSFPESLSEAGITIKAPFADAGVKMRTRGKHFFIYTIGLDGEDGGGAKYWLESTSGDDFGFMIPARPKSDPSASR